MARWQRKARLVIASVGVVFLVVVVFAFKRRSTDTAPASPIPTDPGAVVSSLDSTTQRFNLSKENVRVRYDKLLTYANGPSKVFGITIETENRGGRSFTITAKEGEVGQNDSSFTLTHDVRMEAAGGMIVNTEKATYENSLVESKEPVTFTRGRMSGSGVGLKYEDGAGLLAILHRAGVPRGA